MLTEHRWRVDPARHDAFVELSGDRNPFHVDPVAARRVLYGRVSVHGMHLLLDTLERVLADTDLTPHRLRCTFLHPIEIGEPIVTTIDATSATSRRIRIGVGVRGAADVTVDLGDRLAGWTAEFRAPLERVPEVHTLEALVGICGTIPLAIDTGLVTTRYPVLSARLGIGTIAELVSLTRLVGMYVPGLHSLDSALDIHFHDVEQALGTGDSPVLTYAVTDADPRFSRATIAADGPTVSAAVKAFVRPEPVVQTLGETRPFDDEFAGQRWLVVGGSRGLGAVAVLLLDAGGADVRFTYRIGAHDAGDLTDRTRGATAFQLDVEQLDAPDGGLDAVTRDGWWPSHVVYMATPPMSDGARDAFSEPLARRYTAIYVSAFETLIERLDPPLLAGIVWPSTALADGTPGKVEFVEAKRAGELACARLRRSHPTLRIASPRLPRLLTDQTTSYVPTEFGDTAGEILSALRHAAG